MPPFMVAYERSQFLVYKYSELQTALKGGSFVLHKNIGQEDATERKRGNPLGWHRNAHENTLGTLFMFKLA